MRPGHRTDQGCSGTTQTLTWIHHGFGLEQLSWPPMRLMYKYLFLPKYLVLHSLYVLTIPVLWRKTTSATSNREVLLILKHTFMSSSAFFLSFIFIPNFLSLAIVEWWELKSESHRVLALVSSQKNKTKPTKPCNTWWGHPQKQNHGEHSSHSGFSGLVW